MTRAIFGRSSSTLASRSIIEAMISTWYGGQPARRSALASRSSWRSDALHQVDHPLDHLASVLVVRDLVGVGEQQALERCETFGLPVTGDWIEPSVTAVMKRQRVSARQLAPTAVGSSSRA